MLESFVRRSTDEETYNQECDIAVNWHCETVVCEAMDLYWRGTSQDGLGEWHFFKTSVVEKLRKYDDNSEVLHRIINEKNNYPTHLKFALIFCHTFLSIGIWNWEYQLPTKMK